MKEYEISATVSRNGKTFIEIYHIKSNQSFDKACELLTKELAQHGTVIIAIIGYN